MGWEKKARINKLLIFCETWKTKDEIQEEFELTGVEAWHCVRFLGRLSHDVIVEKRVGATKRAYKYKARIRSFEKAVEEEKLKEKVEVQESTDNGAGEQYPIDDSKEEKKEETENRPPEIPQEKAVETKS